MKDIFKGLPRCRATTKEAFQAWFFRIARNKASDALRSKYNSDPEPSEIEEMIERIQSLPAPETSSPGTELDCEYFKKQLQELVGASKFPCDEILWNYLAMDMDIADIAELIGVSYDAARMKINRCLKTAQELAKDA